MKTAWCGTVLALLIAFGSGTLANAQTKIAPPRPRIEVCFVLDTTGSRTTPFWQEIASKADGQFVQIEQSGNMRIVSTPLDGELSRLSGQLSLTVVPYGDSRVQAAVRDKNTNAQRAASARGAADSASVADRVSVMNAGGAAAGTRAVVTGEGELIRDIANGKVTLESVKVADLPPNMQEMTARDRREYVADLLVTRKEIQRQVDDLTRQRDDYIKAEEKKLTSRPERFDEKVAEMVRTWAQKKGIAFEPSSSAR